MLSLNFFHFRFAGLTDELRKICFEVWIEGSEGSSQVFMLVADLYREESILMWEDHSLDFELDLFVQVDVEFFFKSNPIWSSDEKFLMFQSICCHFSSAFQNWEIR